MTDSAKQKILKTIEAHGYGWSFCARDFMSELKRNDIDTALFHLMREGKIRKVMRGIYDYPMFSKMLNRQVAPDLEQVAAAIARNLQYEMQPTGNSALNRLNLSTQLPAQYTYLWSGRSRDFKVGTQTIRFRSAAKRDFLPKLLQSRLLVQSLRMLDSTRMDDSVKAALKKCFNQKQWLQIRADTVGVSDRIYRQICELAK
ncbi:MAG: hypothetical protein J5821_01335 [Alphaproteobacteria bacterium]|nr:hypothetical protein [Alphaproteobacteria bacterium]